MPATASGSALSDLWRLDPAVSYLNHGSFGACPGEVLDCRDRLVRDLEASPMEFLVRRLPGMISEALAYVEDLVGAEPGSVVFTPNATHGVNTVLASLDFEPGDEIIFGSHEYFATRNACLRRAARAGASCVEVPMPYPVGSAREVVDAFLSRVTTRTRLAVVDHVSSPTGFVHDLPALVGGFAEAGVEVLVDGAHGPGMVPLDMAGLGAAWYTGNFHKWLCSPKVCAFLYARPDMQERIRPLATSHVPSDFDCGLSPFQLEFLWTGTPDPTAALTVPFAGRYLASLDPGGLEGVMERNRQLALQARDLICGALGREPSCPDSMVGAMASFELPWIDPPEPALPDWVWMDPLQRRLVEEFSTEVPVIYLRSARKRLLRISAQLYNDLPQYAALADLLRPPDPLRF